MLSFLKFGYNLKKPIYYEKASMFQKSLKIKTWLGLFLVNVLFSTCLIDIPLKEKREEALLFQIEISGGIMGLFKKILINSNGATIILDEKGQRKISIPFNELKEMEKLFYQISEEKIGEEYPDCIIYKIKKEEKIVIIIPTPDVENESALRLIKLINNWAL